MKIKELERKISESASGGSTSAGSVASVNTPLGSASGFGGDPASSIYHNIKNNRKKNKKSKKTG